MNNDEKFYSLNSNKKVASLFVFFFFLPYEMQSVLFMGMRRMTYSSDDQLCQSITTVKDMMTVQNRCSLTSSNRHASFVCLFFLYISFPFSLHIYNHKPQRQHQSIGKRGRERERARIENVYCSKKEEEEEDGDDEEREEREGQFAFLFFVTNHHILFFFERLILIDDRRRHISTEKTKFLALFLPLLLLLLLELLFFSFYIFFFVSLSFSFDCLAHYQNIDR